MLLKNKQNLWTTIAWDFIWLINLEQLNDHLSVERNTMLSFQRNRKKCIKGTNVWNWPTMFLKSGMLTGWTSWLVSSPSEREPSEIGTGHIRPTWQEIEQMLWTIVTNCQKWTIRKYSGHPVRSNLKTNEMGLFLWVCNLKLVRWSLSGCFLPVSSEFGSNNGILLSS